MAVTTTKKTSGRKRRMPTTTDSKGKEISPRNRNRAAKPEPKPEPEPQGHSDQDDRRDLYAIEGEYNGFPTLEFRERGATRAYFTLGRGKWRKVLEILSDPDCRREVEDFVSA